MMSRERVSVLLSMSGPALDAALAIVRAWGSAGGKIGGRSRMSKLTRDGRRAFAKKATAARWA